MHLSSLRLAAILLCLLACSFPHVARAQTITAIPAANEAPAPSEAMAQDTHAMLIDAWDAYKEGKVDHAAQIYEQLIEQAPEDPRLLFNLGTVYAKQGLNGFAAWRFLQALRFAPRDAEARANLEIVAPEIFEQTAFSPFPPLNMLYGRLSMNEWAAIAGACLALLLLLGTLYMLLPPGARGRKPLRSLAWIAGLAALLTWPLAISRFYQDEVLWKGVIVAKELFARAGPGDRQTQTFPLPEGSLVVIKRAEGPDWLFISYAGGKKEGFIRRDEARFL